MASMALLSLLLSRRYVDWTLGTNVGGGRGCCVRTASPRLDIDVRVAGAQGVHSGGMVYSKLLRVSNARATDQGLAGGDGGRAHPAAAGGDPPRDARPAPPVGMEHSAQARRPPGLAP